MLFGGAAEAAPYSFGLRARGARRVRATGAVAGPDAQILFVLRRPGRRLYWNRLDHDLRRLVHDLVGDPMEPRLLDDHDRLAAVERRLRGHARRRALIV